MKITQARLKELLHYNPLTGIFTLLIASKRRRVGHTFGPKHPGSYVTIFLDGKIYKAHHLAWLYTHGRFPKVMLDHENRDKGDNAIKNLREATAQQNACNKRYRRKDNTTGFRGVSPSGKRWVAACTANGKAYHLGSYATPEEASAAYEKRSAELHGEFKYKR
jgi:AP2 domain.